MRGLRLLLAVGVTLMAVLVGPAAVHAQAPAGDSVTGTAQLAEAGGPILFDAHSGPSGENPGGTVNLPSIGLVLDVTCLAVHGNRATIGVDVTGSGAGFLYFFEDNDGAGTDAYVVVVSIPLDCSSPLPADATLRPIVAGDITVHDAQPFPTAKDQCKNGGWRNYGNTFKNQGQCVAFMQRGPKA